MNEKQLQVVTFDQAKRLKAAGFDWKTRGFYHYENYGSLWVYKNHNAESGLAALTSAPTVSLALKWIRDTKKILFEITVTSEHGYFFRIWNAEKVNGVKNIDGGYDTYEEAESAILDQLLNLIEIINS